MVARTTLNLQVANQLAPNGAYLDAAVQQIDHLLGLKHRNRTVISWPINSADIIASEERGAASLDERLAAAAKAASAGFGVGLLLDPMVLTSSVDEAAERYGAVVDQALASVPARSVAWLGMRAFSFSSELPALARKRFPGTRIFLGELISTNGKTRYTRFVRERLLKSLWDRAAKVLPQHKIYICGEGPAVWNAIDPLVKSSECIEKRLCNLENLPTSFL